MEIYYLGHSSFKIRTKNAVIITDPFDPAIAGLKFAPVTCDIVTISHHHQDHDFLDKITSNPFIIDAPGEYEVKGVQVLGIPTYHDNKEGTERGKNTVYEIRADGISLVHLGDLGHKLSDKQAEDLDGVDIVFVPIGGIYTIDFHLAQEVVNQLDPKIAIPMHYQTEGLNPQVFKDLSPVSEFLKVMGKTEVVAQDKLVVSKEKLTEEKQVVVLK